MSANDIHWGVAGVGRHGSIRAELDEPISGSGPWSFELRGPRWRFRISVPGPETVRSLLAFVSEHSATPGYECHEILEADEVEIKIAKNSDLGVRFELTVHGSHFTAGGTIQDEDVASLQKALEQVVKDLDT